MEWILTWEVRPRDRFINDDTIAEELRFAGARCDQHETFDAARRALEFDIAAFDYSFDSLGRMVVWEVNPFPDLQTPHGRPAEYLRDTIQQTYRCFADYYHDELAAVSSQNPRV